MTLRRLLAVLGTLVCALALSVPAAAQDGTPTSTTVAVPSQDIVPRPNSGSAPKEAGDRGGALQIGLLALVVVAIGVSWGGMHGYAINPARDLGPRLFTLAAGFRNTGFDGHACWVPVVGPLLGGLIGALTYDTLIRPFVPAARAEGGE